MEDRTVTPKLGQGVYIAEGAVLRGNVTVGDHCGIWFHAVVRTEHGTIEIGSETNIQDNCVLHAEKGADIRIGSRVSVGHGAIVHGCTIGDNTLIGMGAIVMNRAVVGNNCIIGAGALVTQNTVIPDGSLVLGNPAKVKRSVTEEEIAEITANALHYVEETKTSKIR